jgi:hypothetical protein
MIDPKRHRLDFAHKTQGITPVYALPNYTRTMILCNRFNTIKVLRS